MSLSRKSVIIPVLATETTLLTMGASEESVVVSMILGNVDGINDVTVDLALNKAGGGAVDIVTNFPIAAGKAVEFLINGRGNLFLENDDILTATASAASDLVITLSYLLDS